MEALSVPEQLALEGLFSQWKRQHAAGQAVSLAALCAGHPHLLPLLKQRIGALGVVDERAEQTAALPVVQANGASNFREFSASCPLFKGRSNWPRIAGYQVLDELGRGGMGVVYRARQECLDRMVALKVVLHAEYARDGERQRFLTEAHAVAALQHSNIVQIYEVGEHGGVPYLSLEYCGGGSLARKLGGKFLPTEEAARLVETLARAVQAAHARGIIHRDVKPANVLFTEDGTLKLTDFGLARYVGQTGQTMVGEILGTPNYMAPEQAQDPTQAGPAADVYGLGAVLYECLTGRPPFVGRTRTEVVRRLTDEPPAPLAQSPAHTPRQLETICLKCLRKDPSERYASAAELAEALRRFRDEREPIDARVGAPARYPGRCVRLWWASGVAAVLAIISMGAVVFLSRPHGPGTRPAPNMPTTPISASHQQRVQVTRMRVQLTRHDGTIAGVLGEDVFHPRFGDTITLEAQLSQPAHAFLLVFRPDRREPDVCFPQKEEEPPPRTNRPVYIPLKPGTEYGLNDGTGLEAIAVVVSSQPLPPFKEWWAGYKACPWHGETGCPGLAYRANGVDSIEVLPAGDARSKDAAVPGKTAIDNLARWLHKGRGIETVQVLGFTVEPREEP